MRQALFAAIYAETGNGRQSAIRAGYSPNGAEVQAHHLLRNANVKAAIDRKKAAQVAVVDVSAERVARELALLGFANAQDFIGADGKPVRNFKGLSRDQMAAIAGAEFDTRGRLRFKLADKRQALVDLGKHLGMFTERQELAVRGSVRFLIDGLDLTGSNEPLTINAPVAPSDNS